MLHKAHSTEYFMPLSNRPGGAPTKCPLTVQLPRPPTPPSAFEAHGPASLPTHCSDALPLPGQAPIPESAKMITVNKWGVTPGETRATDLPPSQGLESRKGTLEQELGTPLPLCLSPQPGNAAQDATQHHSLLWPLATPRADDSGGAWAPTLSSLAPALGGVQLGKRGRAPSHRVPDPRGFPSHLPRPHRPGPRPRGARPSPGQPLQRRWAPWGEY